MDWATAANLIISIGLPAAEKFWKLATTTPAPTQAAWDQIKAEAAVKASDKMKAQLLAAGIAIDSDQGKAMLALAS